MGGENKPNNIDSTNIFEEFSQDEDLKTEVKNTQEKKERWTYYYLWILSGIIKTFNIVGIIVALIAGGYLYIQNNEEITNVSFLEPICWLFVGKDYVSSEPWCSSVSSLAKKYEGLNIDVSKKYYWMVANAIEDVYYVSNFAFSNDVLFLLDKTTNRLSLLGMIEKFDTLKNEFEPINKGKILCSNIEISSDGMFSIDCSAFSSRWDRNIVWLSWKNQKSENVSGTSISIASSFINYIEKKSEDFIIIDKQKEFSFTDVANYWGYSRKTDFTLNVKLRSNTLLLK